jgi:hypothetical protein
VDAAKKLEPPERESVLDFAELCDSVLVEPSERITLGAGLMGAADRAALHALELLTGVIAKGIEARIEATNVVALTLDLG